MAVLNIAEYKDQGEQYNRDHRDQDAASSNCCPGCGRVQSVDYRLYDSYTRFSSPSYRHQQRARAIAMEVKGVYGVLCLLCAGGSYDGPDPYEVEFECV